MRFLYEEDYTSAISKRERDGGTPHEKFLATVREIELGAGRPVAGGCLFGRLGAVPEGLGSVLILKAGMGCFGSSQGLPRTFASAWPTITSVKHGGGCDESTDPPSQNSPKVVLAATALAVSPAAQLTIHDSSRSSSPQVD